jgi:hypothetical protein
MDDGAFSIDFAAAYTVLAVLLVCVFFTAENAISVSYTAGYADELGPVAERLGDVLLKSPGEPDSWYMGPSDAANARIVGLSDGRPNVLSSYKVDGLGMYNAQGLKGALGLGDPGGQYGLRVEIKSLDGGFSRAFGYPLPPDTVDVCKSCRLAAVEEPAGSYRDARVLVYLWRRDVGATT